MSYEIVKRKIRAGKIFKCENFNAFISSIVTVLPFEGFSMSRFYICQYDGVQFLTKLMFYRKSAPEIYGRVTSEVSNQTDTEIKILKILRDKIINAGVSPCILEIIFDKICENVTDRAPNEKICDQIGSKKESPINNVNSTLCSYADLVAGGLAHDKCAFVVLERCDISLDEYLKKNLGTPISFSIIKSILFQVIYTVYAIQRIYPKYHHYDLHTENIMLKFDTSYKFKASNQKFMIFKIPKDNNKRSDGNPSDGTQDSTSEDDFITFVVPYFGIVAKIIDFGFSTIPEEGVISDFTADIIQTYYRSQNDLLFLFHWISRTVRKTDPTGFITKMLRQLEPNEMYVRYNTERIRGMEDQIPTYNDMVRNKLFAEYTKVEVNPSQVYGTYSIK
jgi:hypothetical protein